MNSPPNSRPLTDLVSGGWGVQIGVDMAKQAVTIVVSQQSSGGPVRGRVTYTSDGVIVKSRAFSVKPREGATVSLALSDLLTTSALDVVKWWERQTALW